MKISPIRFNRPSFKSVYPVVFHIEQKNGVEYQVNNTRFKSNLLSKLVRYCNGSVNKKNKKNIDLSGRTYRFFIRKDNDYARNPHVAKFGNYLITGGDAETFRETIGKSLGIAKATCEKGSVLLKEAKKKYQEDGLKFVKEKSANKELHVLFSEEINPITNETEYILKNMKLPTITKE